MKILIISLSGMGNTLMYTPALRLLRKKFPDARIDFLVRKKFYGSLLKNNRDKDNILSIQDGSWFNVGVNLLKLMLERYDISIINFPSRKFSLNLFSYLVHAKKRLVHSYDNAYFSTFSQNKKLRADPELHDIEQNLALLKLLGINYSKEDTKMVLDIENDMGDNFLKQNKISEKDFIVGIHAGSSTDYNAEFKRWPVERFVGLCNKLMNKHNAKIFIFGGPEEKKLKEKLNNLLNDKGWIFDGKMDETASVIKKCKLFITNDSGLMHIAVAAGIKVVAMIGPTSGPTDTNIRTRAYGDNSIIIKKDGCKCYFYPFFTSSAHIGCEKNCLSKISVEEVYERIKQKI
ncbi:MAG: ADP-heptose:LPS heptosyltransferase [Parcubacteria group bacterium GW2011_GWA1_36_12]|nr:MAG: ADP-heptose:LPS heptosyltransferase [Parcubacteria group bacterium GW2011_GWA1_36_12]